MKKNQMNKKGQFAVGIIAVFVGLLILMILALIFKNSLIGLFGAFADFFKSPTFWIMVIISLLIIFRKFVEQVLMTIWNLIKGVLKI